MAGNQHLHGLDSQKSHRPFGPHEKPKQFSDDTPAAERKDTETDSEDTEEL